MLTRSLLLPRSVVCGDAFLRCAVNNGTSRGCILIELQSWGFFFPNDVILIGTNINPSSTSRIGNFGYVNLQSEVECIINFCGLETFQSFDQPYSFCLSFLKLFYPPKNDTFKIVKSNRIANNECVTHVSYTFGPNFRYSVLLRTKMKKRSALFRSYHRTYVFTVLSSGSTYILDAMPINTL